MTYAAMAEMARDEDLLARVTACAAEQGADSPEYWTHEHRWQIAAQPGWASSWDYAHAAGVARPGWDAGVITDGAILASVQALMGRVG